jgi:hypothetical protein
MDGGELDMCLFGYDTIRQKYFFMAIAVKSVVRVLFSVFSIVKRLNVKNKFYLCG